MPRRTAWPKTQPSEVKRRTPHTSHAPQLPCRPASTFEGEWRGKKETKKKDNNQLRHPSPSSPRNEPCLRFCSSLSFVFVWFWFLFFGRVLSFLFVSCIIRPFSFMFSPRSCVHVRPHCLHCPLKRSRKKTKHRSAARSPPF